MGSFSSVIMQAHELGHAFHDWATRDLPTVQTEFPMTLTESLALSMKPIYVTIVP